MKRRVIKIKSGKSVIMNVILLLSVLTTTIVYSAFSTQLQIQGDAVLRAKKDIRITDIKASDYGTGGETANPKYSVDTTSMYVNLPPNSHIKYEITITNKSDVDYWVSKIEDTTKNSGLSSEDIQKIIDEIDVIDYASSGPTEKKFKIKLENKTEETQQKNIMLQYTFEEATYTASQLSYSNSYTKCTTAQCALDELHTIIKR